MKTRKPDMESFSIVEAETRVRLALREARDTQITTISDQVIGLLGRLGVIPEKPMEKRLSLRTALDTFLAENL